MDELLLPVEAMVGGLAGWVLGGELAGWVMESRDRGYRVQHRF